MSADAGRAASGDAVIVSGEAPAGRSWTITLPAGLPVANLNDRSHWAPAHAIRRQLLDAALIAIRAARVPHLDRVTVTVIYDPPPNGRHRDADNIALSAKAFIDAMRPPMLKVGKRWVRAPRAGYVLPDDDSAHVIRSTTEIGQPYPLGRFRMIIDEVAGDD